MPSLLAAIRMHALGLSSGHLGNAMVEIALHDSRQDEVRPMRRGAHFRRYSRRQSFRGEKRHLPRREIPAIERIRHQCLHDPRQPRRRVQNFKTLDFDTFSDNHLILRVCVQLLGTTFTPILLLSAASIDPIGRSRQRKSQSPANALHFGGRLRKQREAPLRPCVVHDRTLAGGKGGPDRLRQHPLLLLQLDRVGQMANAG